MVEKQAGTRPRTQVQALEDEELQGLRAEVSRAREHLAVLELELFNTHSALEEFQRRFNARIAPLERRLAGLQAQLKQALSARRGANGTPAAAARRAENGAEQHTRTHSRAEEAEAEPAAPEENNKPSPEVEEELRSLFRELAKRFHPDLVCDPEEKKERAEIMARVGEAYAHHDLDTLRELARRPDLKTEKAQTRRKEKELLRAELEYLTRKIVELEQRCRMLDQSPAMQLRMEANMARQVGRDLLSDMAAHLEERIADIEDHLWALGEDPDVTVA